MASSSAAFAVATANAQAEAVLLDLVIPDQPEP